MNIFFFKRPKPRPFNYRPIYYDKEKEEAKERKNARNGMADKNPAEYMRAEIRRKWKIERKDSKRKNEVYRIFFYLIIAGFAIYLIFFTDLVNKFVSFFFR